MCLISTSDVENDYGSVVVQEAEDLGDAALISKKNVLVPLAIHAMFCHFQDLKRQNYDPIIINVVAWRILHEKNAIAAALN